jgi:hypothetical protein
MPSVSDLVSPIFSLRSLRQYKYWLQLRSTQYMINKIAQGRFGKVGQVVLTAVVQ